MYAQILRQVESVADSDPVAGLLAGIVARDRGAMEHFYRRFQGNVYRYALAALGDPIAAADVLHQVMFGVWKDASDYAGGDPLVWLLGRTHRCLRPGVPAGTDGPEANLPEPGHDAAPPDARIGRMPDAPAVRAALLALPVPLRLALHLAFAEDLSYSDIADVMDDHEEVSRRRILIGQRRLQQRLCG